MTIDRYTVGVFSDGRGAYDPTMKDPDGDYVRFEDHQAQREDDLNELERLSVRLIAVDTVVKILEMSTAAARRNREPKTGMQVPYMGEFCSATPSVLRDLDNFVRQFKRALRVDEPPPRSSYDQGYLDGMDAGVKEMAQHEDQAKRLGDLYEQAIALMADVEALPPETFEQVWARMQAKGYQYGEEALQNVRFGWELAHGREE